MDAGNLTDSTKKRLRFTYSVKRSRFVLSGNKFI